MGSEHHLLGQTYALLAAITWATALVLFKRSGEQYSPLALNLYKTMVGLVLLLGTLCLQPLWGDNPLLAVEQHGWRSAGILLLSGALGIALADTIFFYALNLIGVGLISIVDCAYTPFVVLFSWLLLEEDVTMLHYVGGLLVISGVFIASQHEPPIGRTRGQLILGMLLAPFAIGLMAFGIVLAKPVLQGYPMFEATSLRMLAGSALLVLFASLDRNRRQNWAVFRPNAIWRFALPASILGTYLSMIFWVGGFKYTTAMTAAVLNQTSVIFALLLAAVFLRERLDERKIASVVLALAGVVLVTKADEINVWWFAGG